MLLGAYLGTIFKLRKRKEGDLTYNRVEPESRVQRQLSRIEPNGNNMLDRKISRKELGGTHQKRELVGDTRKGFGSEQLRTVAEMDITSAA